LEKKKTKGNDDGEVKQKRVGGMSADHQSLQITGEKNVGGEKPCEGRRDTKRLKVGKK